MQFLSVTFKYAASSCCTEIVSSSTFSASVPLCLICSNSVAFCCNIFFIFIGEKWAACDPSVLCSKRVK